MRKSKYILNLFAAVALLSACSESLEDTYSDFAGDGKIRYVAKCTDFHANSGWERILLEWKNNTDATIDKIKVVCTIDGKKDSVFLPKTSTSYELKNLKDGTYRFDICALDGAGNESMKEITYGRPYTRNHEIMRAFTRGVVKSYFLKNKMMFFSDLWNENIVDLKLKYKNTAGETIHYEFKKESSFNTFITIDDISMNPADTIYVIRKGRPEGCTDIIDYEPVVIDRLKHVSAAFIDAIQRRYGYSTDTKEEEVKFYEFIEKVEELEFDYEMETFEDILYCSNLKKLVFGKNRYLFPASTYATVRDRSGLRGDEKKSILVLDKANELLDLTIDYYASQIEGVTNIPYFSYELSYMNFLGYSTFPKDLQPIGKEALKVNSFGDRISCVPKDLYANVNNLVDNRPQTRWETTSFGSIREYELQMELLEDTEIRGVKVAQILHTPNETQAPLFMPSRITVLTSTDAINWKKVTYFEDNELGSGAGEVTYLPIAEGTRVVRFVKFLVRDGIDIGGNCMCKLGDLILCK